MTGSEVVEEQVKSIRISTDVHREFPNFWDKALYHMAKDAADENDKPLHIMEKRIFGEITSKPADKMEIERDVLWKIIYDKKLFDK